MVMVKYYKHLSLIHKYFHDSFVKAVIVTLQTFPGLSLRWSGPAGWRLSYVISLYYQSKLLITTISSACLQPRQPQFG